MKNAVSYMWVVTVICFIDRRSTHHYHSLVRIIMNICNLNELDTGNPNLSLSLILIYLRKTKAKFLCAAYSPRQYYSSSQTSVLVTTGKAWLLRSFITTRGLKMKMFFRDSSVYVL